ncbi:DUF6114 domain-containing protein [Halorientalis litorea]|uniref:DUF6114 domain-containing protein n=1 Tax=Halorientalis litorea TaxID=2931977 RepID=UPI001FF2CC4F|nr:DUF6114 domain-containing protein [Halorientalis litorea]
MSDGDTHSHGNGLLAAVSTVSRRRLARANRWRRGRPFGGGVLLILGGLMVTYVSGGYARDLLLIGGAYTSIGLVVALLMVLSGIAALAMPEESSIVGIVGTAMALLSLLTALGGLLIGMLLGIHGGVAVWAWEREDEE